MAAQKKLAVFDVDGTIFRSSLVIELMEQLIRDGAVSSRARASYERAYLEWRDREGPYEEFAELFTKAAKRHFRGIHYGEFADASKIVIGEQGRHIYRYTRDLIAELNSRGYFLLAISHSPKTIVEPFCKKLGFDKAYGVVWEIGPQDLLTGEVADAHLIWNKANILKRAVEKEDLTLRGSIGVGDTEADIPFLEMVAKAVCFNPNQKLYKYAKRMKWKVVVERKDVVYEL